jgi:hypothetical protein
LAGQLLAPKINVTLHDGQLEVLDDSRRFRVVACGRRWGKTTFAVADTLIFAAETPDSLVWWVSSTHDQTRIAMRMLLQAVPPDARDVNLSEKTVTLWNGSRFMFRSANKHDNLRGEGVDYLVIDEAAFIEQEAWYSSLRPTLADTRGSALLISTFQGENWFYELYERGQDDSFEDWGSYRYPTINNPFIHPDEIDEARRTTPRAQFEQEWEANPLIYVGAVFPGEKVQQATERVAVYRDDLPCFAGLDWGYTNATAFEVCQEDPEGRVHWFAERLAVATQLDTRVEFITSLCREHRIEAVYADAAGATENAALADALDRAGLATQLVAVPFGKFKEGGIKTRRWFLENDLETMGPNVPELIRTTKRYRYKEDSEDVIKEDDHPVDAATAFYASRRSRIVEDR